jgi:hypothetical protein
VATGARRAQLIDDSERPGLLGPFHIGEPPILWNSQGQRCNPDLIVVRVEGLDWGLEVKMEGK